MTGARATCQRPNAACSNTPPSTSNTQPDHPSVSVYPRWTGNEGVDTQRLYALGIDAFRIARELALRPGSVFEVDGVTGRLKIDMGGSAPVFRRIESGVVYRDGGVFEQAAFGR